MLLDTTTKIVRFLLTEAGATVMFVAAYADTESGTTFVPGGSDGVSNGTTPVTVVAAPATGLQRHVKSLNFFNSDAVQHEVTVQAYDGANARTLFKVTLQPTETLYWSVERGWEVDVGIDLGGFTTDDLPEGVTNLYFTNERAQDATGAMVGTSLIYNDGANTLVRAALTGDVTAPQDSNVTTLATVNGNVGTFGDASHTLTLAVNAKGLVTAVSVNAIAITDAAITYGNETANTVHAGPAAGGAAPPTWRALVAADIPSLSATYVLKAGDTMGGALKFSDGAAATPSAYFDTDRGFFNDTTNTGIGIAVGGVATGRLIATGLTMQNTGGSSNVTNESDSNASMINTVNATNTIGPISRLRKARGTAASRAVVANGDTVGSYEWQAHTGSGFVGVSTMTVSMFEGTPGTTAMGVSAEWFLTPPGSVTLTRIMGLNHTNGWQAFGVGAGNTVIDTSRRLANTTATAPIQPTLSDAVTNTSPDGEIINHITSGTAAVGFGVSWTAGLENASGTLKTSVGSMSFEWSDATNATEDADFVLRMMAAGAAKAEKFRVSSTGNVTATGTIKGLTTTVGALPAAGTAGRRAFVTDANATTFASIVAAGGANGVPVYDDGTNWRIG